MQIEEQKEKEQHELANKQVSVEHSNQEISLENKLKEKDATIQALQGMLAQMVPVVESILPLLKERPEFDKSLLAQIEKITQIAKMMSNMGQITTMS